MARRMPARDSKGRFKKRGVSSLGKAKRKGKAKSSGKTFIATAAYAKNADGSTRKGCRKVKGRYRCRMPGR